MRTVLDGTFRGGVYVYEKKTVTGSRSCCRHDHRTGWQKIRWKNKDCWFYFNASGKMLTGWQKLKWGGGTDYFYFDSNGVMAANTSIDGYRVDADGVYSMAAMIAGTKTAKKTSQIILVNGHTISLWNKSGSTWKKQLEDYCGYGKNGLKLAANRVQGDKTTPVGSFPILFAFGKASNPVVYGKGSAIFLHCKSTNSWNTAGCVSVYEKTMVSLLKACGNGTYIIIVPNEKSIANY